MEVFTQVFRQRQRNELKKQLSKETNSGNDTIIGSKKVGFNESTNFELKHLPLNQSTNSKIYFERLKPKVHNEFLEFDDRYEIHLNCSMLQKNQITVKFNEINNQIKIICLQSKKVLDKVIVERKIFRCFQLPDDICSDQITGVIKQSNQLKICIPKFKRILDSDGESSFCYECEESNDLFN